MITHPEKVLFPDDGISKGELAAYYEAVAPLMLPHIRRRPITMERYPAGIGEPGFFHKDVSKGFPEWLNRASSARYRHTIAALDHQSELHHAARVDLARAKAVPAGYLRLRPRPVASGRSGRAARRCARVARSLDRTDAPQLGQDIRLERVSHRRAA